MLARLLGRTPDEPGDGDEAGDRDHEHDRLGRVEQAQSSEGGHGEGEEDEGEQPDHPRFLPRNEGLTPVSGGSQLDPLNLRAPNDPKEPM